jgi:riboflavin kinase/FMN adenylyltransferase
MLGHPVSLIGKVMEGKHLGHVLGFPTANLIFKNGLVAPKRGIYAALCYTEDGERHIGVANVGIRPTVTDGSDSHTLNCEIYILNFNKSIYGSTLKVEFVEYLRDEKKFDSLRDLSQQIAKDAIRAKDFFEAQGITP